jgi:two-component system, cell cycle response regulator CpdR
MARAPTSGCARSRSRATEIDPDLKVMFITGFAAVALNPDSRAPKDAKVLSKPFHLRDLVNEVEKMLKAA